MARTQEVVVFTDSPWSRPPFVLAWNDADGLPRRAVRVVRRFGTERVSPGIVARHVNDPFDFSAAVAALCADACQHVPEFRHIDARRVLFGFFQARSGRGNGLQARVTPLRFPGGAPVRAARGRLFQVQRYVVGGRDMLYLMSFCLPRFLDQGFDDKFVTIFHELYHIGPRFDGDLRRHRGRCCLHTRSKAGYDEHMAKLARAYLAGGAPPHLHQFLRLDFEQLRARHGAVVGVRLPRPKIVPVPLEVAQACRVT